MGMRVGRFQLVVKYKQGPRNKDADGLSHMLLDFVKYESECTLVSTQEDIRA